MIRQGIALEFLDFLVLSRTKRLNIQKWSVNGGVHRMDALQTEEHLRTVRKILIDFQMAAHFFFFISPLVERRSGMYGRVTI